MSRRSADRNLLVGIVAFQMEFVTKDELVVAMQAWLLAKDQSLGGILERAGVLETVERAAIEALVDRHVLRHRGDPEASLSALANTEATRSVLDGLKNAVIDSSAAEREPSTAAADPEATLDPPPFGTHANCSRFEIIRLHDQGGLGSVFLARDLELNRNVALKMLKDEISRDGQSRARFLMEAEITGNLEHPGIVPVHARGLGRDGLPYYAMRFVKGQNLKDALDRFYKPRDEAGDPGDRDREFQGFLRRFLTICETVSYAHGRSVLHRDLKPRNVLLGPFGETLVVDWGLAKPMGRPEQTPPTGETLRPASGSDVQPTQAGARLGTPAYMSPEQARGDLDRLDVRTDVYGLGATLYYILTGRAPYLDQDGAAILAKVERGGFPAPRRINPRVSRSIEAVCLKAMALEPKDRYPTARALADDVERWLADQTPLAYRQPPLARVGRWLRRRKKLAAAAAVLLIAAAAVLAWHDRGLAVEKANTEAALGQVAQQLAMTRAALSKLLEVAATGIASYPNGAPLRANLGKIVLDMYGKLVAEHPDNTELHFELAKVHYLLGRLAQVNQAHADALAAFQQVLILLEPLVADSQTHARAVRLLVKARIDRATAWDEGERPRAAEDDFSAALDLIAEYSGDLDPAEADELRASALFDRSELYIKRGAFKEARDDADAAVALLEKAVQQPRPDADSTQKRDYSRLLLAMALADRGQSNRGLDDATAAEKDFAKAIRVLEAISDESALLDDFHAQSASAQVWLGKVVGGDPNRLGEAEASFNEAVAVLQALAKKQPESPFFPELLADALLARGRLALQSNDLAAAKTDLRAAALLIADRRSKDPESHDLASLAARRLELEADALQKAGAPETAARRRQAIELLEKNLERNPDRHQDKFLIDRLRGPKPAR